MSNEGILNQIGVATESVYGTAVAPELSVPILPSDGIRTEQEAVGVEAIDTSPALNKGFVRGVRNYPGSFALNAYPNALGYFLYSALGAVSSEVVYGESLVYEHVFTEAVAKPSLTVEQVIGEIEERYAGYIASGFNIEFQVGQPISITSQGMAKTVATQEKTSPVYEALEVLKWDEVTEISVDGDDIKAYVESGNIQYSNGLATFVGFGTSNEPTTHYVENSEVTGSLTLFMDGNSVDALLDKFRDKTEMPIILTVQGQAVGDASNVSLQVTIPRAAITAYNTQLDTSYNQVTLDFVGAKDLTDGLIEVTLVNTYETYVAE